MENHNPPMNNRGTHTRHSRKKSKGHGCLGFGIVFSLLAVALICVLLFTTDVLNAPKNKVLSLIYPRHYTDEVEAAAKEFGVDESLIYAVIRAESNFDEDVESHAGAIGLMQLMPETFTWLQEHKDSEVIYTEDALKIPEVNIRYGAYYLFYLTDLYGDVSTALAAYNAGTSNVDEWLKNPDYSSDGKTLSEIPYSETKSYVKKVTRAQDRYRSIYNIP